MKQTTQQEVQQEGNITINTDHTRKIPYYPGDRQKISIILSTSPSHINHSHKLFNLFERQSVLEIEIWRNTLYSFIILNRHCFKRQWKNGRLCRPTGNSLEGCDSCMAAYTTELRDKYQYKRGRPAFTKGGLSALYCKQYHSQQNTNVSKIHPNLHATHVSNNLLR